MLEPDTEITLDNVHGKSLDIELVIEPFAARRCGVKVCCSPGGEEETVTGYDAAEGKLFIDTLRSSTDSSQPVAEGGPLSLCGNELLHLRVLVDKSVVEVFANERQGVMRRVYPTRVDSTSVKLFTEGGAARIHSVTAWDMMPSNPY